jgi:hypothetical protein
MALKTASNLFRQKTGAYTRMKHQRSISRVINGGTHDYRDYQDDDTAPKAWRGIKDPQIGG